ncbi:hypothetical protein [Kitasatospora cathayae]|uniref:Uncharacterized protein n=1 Tax=Kitasatospora cathayae TaxID=3004092 RepID=A0ABY7Q1L6_9ACTN|nr:hypothetical protein [Kitasatospora sp. HUAS 3-15]WBP86516.1 hypothetical protein O1G21_12135 [Kitasatospora sp. HUAS 3-15]
MAVRGETARDVQHEPARQGRHGRPRPFGGRFRLPTLRFSGAAMAMSTVVGISIATTLLLNEQQGIGRRAGVARVGSTPPPSPGSTDQAEAASERTPDTPAPSGRPHGPKPSGHASTHPAGPANAAATPPAGLRAGTAVPVTPSTGGQASAGHDPRSSAPAGGTGTDGQPDAGASPSATPATPTTPFAPSAGQTDAGQSPPPPGLQPTTPARPGPAFPAPGRPTPPPEAAVPGPGSNAGPGTSVGATGTDATDATAITGTSETAGAGPEADQTLTGTGLTTPLGRDGLRHALDLTVAEPVTALQAEFRLAPGELAPGGGAAWTDLPGAVVTTQQERGTLVYRFTTPPGTDVKPGRYTFAVRGARPADQVGPVRKPGPPESWNAAAFGIDHPRAVAALGCFGPLLPQPAQHLAHRAR